MTSTKLSIGILGMPNVGKSTFFNILTNLKVESENYPFCTIDPHFGLVPVYDKRLDILAKIEKSEKIVPATFEAVDIAGLVKGAHKGEGLGNAFLANVRETNAIVHLLRDFKGQVTHVEGKVDPLRDKEIIETELILKDLETIEKQNKTLNRESKSDVSIIKLKKHLKELEDVLQKGLLAKSLIMPLDESVLNYRKGLFLLTDKPFMYVINRNINDSVIDHKLLTYYRETLNIGPSEDLIILDLKLEEEFLSLTEEEKIEFMKGFNISKSGIEVFTETAYKLLNLISFFTSGVQETRAWPIYKGTKMNDASGKIHTDFKENFIKADVVSINDFIENSGWLNSRKAGKVRLEGKDYIVEDGDVVIIKHF